MAGQRDARELRVSPGVAGRAAHKQPQQKPHQSPSVLNRSVFASISLTPSPPLSMQAQDLGLGAVSGTLAARMCSTKNWSLLERSLALVECVVELVPKRDGVY